MTTATANLPLRAARFYARSGLSVLAWRYTDGAKRPAHAWKTMQDFPQTVDDVTAWWRAHPDDNVGIVTGAISNLVIVDCDDDAAIAWVEDNLPPTDWIVQTGRGRQYGYRHPGEQVKNRAHIAGMALDLRGDGGYVSAPPSVHKSGAVYSWIGKPWLDGAQIPTFDPAWLPPDPQRVTPPREPMPQGVSDASRLRGAAAWFAQREPAIAGQGGRHWTLKTTARAATLGVSFADALDLLRGWNANCQPPWPESDLQEFLRSGWEKNQ